MPAGRGLPKSAFHGLREKLGSLSRRDLLFDYDQPKHFLEPAVGGRHKLYVTYRCMAAMYFSIVLLVTLLSDIQNPPFLPYIYFTNWTAVLLAITTILQAIAATRHYSTDNDNHLPEKVCLNEETGTETKTKKSTRFQKVLWMFHTASLTGNIYVMKYWVFKALVDPHGSALTYPVISKHGVNVVYVLIDFFVTGMPVRLLHFWIPMLFGSLYCLFAIIYWAAGGRNFDGVPGTYPILNFTDRPVAASMTVVLSNVICLVLHSMWFLIYKLRCCLYSSTCCRTKHNTTLEPGVAVIETKDRRKFNHYDVVKNVVDKQVPLI